jgi:two-component system, NtrC family, sensor histidine kinase KinB
MFLLTQIRIQSMRSLRSKIGLGYFVIIVINIMIAVFAVYHINQLSTPINEILKDKYQNLNAAENMSKAIQQQELVQFEMLESAFDSSLVISFNTYKNEFLNWHQRVIEGIALPAEPDILDSLRKSFQLYLTNSETLQSLLEKKESYRRCKTNHINKVLPLVQKINELCNQLKFVNERAIADADIKTEIISERANFIIIIISVSAILISILASIYFTQKILKPVQKTTETVRKISQGQLNQKIEIVSDDEIAELGLEFNRMTERLDEYEKLNINKILLEKRKAEAIVNNIPVLIIVIDNDNKMTLANEYALKLLDIGNSDWQNKLISELIPEKKLVNLFTKLNAKFCNTEFNPESSLFPIEIEKKTHFFLTRQIPISDQNGNQTNIVTLMQDVTSFKNLDKLKSEFIATISHEIKTPLTSINMIVDILLKGIKGSLGIEQKELLQDAQHDIARLQSLTKELLDLSKLESGKISFNIQSIKVTDIIECSVEQLKLFIKDKNLHVIVDTEEKVTHCKGDSNQLCKVFTNILKNAIQHSSPNGKIKIVVKNSNKFVQFSISDNGNGIPKESLDVIFDKFVQVNEFISAESGNIGLGLAIAKEIVNTHNGNIWVESGIGKGSTFYFTVPMSDNHY